MTCWPVQGCEQVEEVCDVYLQGISCLCKQNVCHILMSTVYFLCVEGAHPPKMMVIVSSERPLGWRRSLRWAKLSISWFWRWGGRSEGAGGAAGGEGEWAAAGAELSAGRGGEGEWAAAGAELSAGRGGEGEWAAAGAELSAGRGGEGTNKLWASKGRWEWLLLGPLSVSWVFHLRWKGEGGGGGHTHINEPKRNLKHRFS